MDNKKLHIGNVEFDEDSVLCSKYVYEKGQRFNHVFLVGGTKIMYPDQEKMNAAVSIAKKYNSEMAELCTWFKNIKGLIIEESPNPVNYYVRES